MANATPPLEEGQRESVGGIFGPILNVAQWVDVSWRRKITALFMTILAVVIIAVLAWRANPVGVAESLRQITGTDLEEEIKRREAAREGEEISEKMCRAVEELIIRHDAARGVTRTLLMFTQDGVQVIEVEDVCESNDAQGERGGIRSDPLPYSNIANTLRTMRRNRYVKELPCIKGNAEDYPDEGLKSWMARHGLRSSVACLISDIDRRDYGLLAISSRQPIEDLVGLEQDVAISAATMSGYWDRATNVREANQRILERRQ